MRATASPEAGAARQRARRERVSPREDGDVLEVRAPACSDFFIDPASGDERDDAPFHYVDVTGDFTARVKVRPAFRRTYDAGGLLVLDRPRRWIKHELERTDLGYPAVVCVVTDGTSDDSNGERMDGREAVCCRWRGGATSGRCTGPTTAGAGGWRAPSGSR